MRRVLISYSRNGHLQIAQLLIKVANIDVNIKSWDEDTALHLAIRWVPHTYSNSNNKLYSFIYNKYKCKSKSTSGFENRTSLNGSKHNIYFTRKVIYLSPCTLGMYLSPYTLGMYLSPFTLDVIYSTDKIQGIKRLRFERGERAD